MPGLIVFASGALLMVLEMVGARVMAPHLGTSVIVWTSLIGVVLACLACGACIGGRLADKKLSRKTLAAILSGAGFGCGITALVHPLVGAAVSSAIPNIYLAAVVAAVCIFALPATLFGMVSPYVIRLSLASLATSGSTVGYLYALSTAGSIVGTFLGGFVLISWFSSTQILLATGGAMLLLSLISCWQLPALRVALLLFFPVAAWGNASYTTWLVAQGTLPPVETPYNSIRIMEAHTPEKRLVRVMATDPGYMQSGMYVDTPSALYFEYTRYYSLGTVLFPHATKVLMLGGGGYSVPKWLLAGHGGLNSQKLTVDVVELDPGMTKVARTYFALPDDPRLTVFHDDARRFVNANTQMYDLVFVDVFNSHYSVPFHVGTVEAAKAMRRAVAPHGALLMNVISAVEGPDGELFRAIYGALGEAFAEIHVFAVSDQKNLRRVQNLMILALPEKNPSLRAMLEGARTHLSPPIQGMLATRITSPMPTGTLPLRDDFAPVERYAQALLK
ncbi:MAG: fused MFS/spermidine synthase [Desulfovibrionaceae bacterium]